MRPRPVGAGSAPTPVAGSCASLAFAVCSSHRFASDTSEDSAGPPPCGLSANMNASWRRPALLNLPPPSLHRHYPASSLLWGGPTSPQASGVRRCLRTPYRSLTDPWRSPGVRMSNVPPLPPRLLSQLRSEIGRRASGRTYPAWASLLRGSLAFGAAVRLGLPSHTASRQRFGSSSSPSSRAVASDSRLPPTGPAGDFHPQSLIHAQRTLSRLRRVRHGTRRKTQLSMSC